MYICAYLQTAIYLLINECGFTYCNLGCSIDTRIHNGLEMQYILRLRARYGHVMTFMGHSSIFNRHNTFLSNSPRVFLKTCVLFNLFILF